MMIMSALTGSCFLRFLLSLVVRLRLSVARVALAFRAQFAPFYRSLIAYARCGGQSRIQPCSSNAPTVVERNTTGQYLQCSEGAKGEEETIRTLAVPPVRPNTSAYWEDQLSKYSVPTQASFELCPATPDKASQRYNPPKPAKGSGGSSLELRAGQLDLLPAISPSLPDGWIRHIHPEGNVIYYHTGLRVFTENDVCQRGADLLHCTFMLIQKANKHGIMMDELTEVVLNLDDKGNCQDNKRNCQYYFVDHTRRLIFWVENLKPVEKFHIRLQEVGGHNHIKYWIEAKYWLHCQFFPHNRALPKGVLRDLRGMLNYAKTDVMTADSSTSPFAQDELVAILDLVNSLKDDGIISDPYSIWIIGRLMAIFEVQFLNFCGQPCARLNADTPLFGKQTWNRSWIFRTVNIFLFGSPNEHAVRLQRVWVDKIIIQPRWKDFVNRLTSEFAGYTIFSTVLLAVNFGFLAPGLVDTGPTTSPTQILIYCSEVSTIGSIVFSLALLKVYSNPELLIAHHAAAALRILSTDRSGMARLAIAHSLPIACLIWSITFFAAAVLVQIFGRNELGTYVALGVECLVLVLFGMMSRGAVVVVSRGQ